MADGVMNSYFADMFALEDMVAIGVDVSSARAVGFV
jgi:hypothetical protein